MTQKLSGRDVEARLSNGLRVSFQQASLELDDGVSATQDQGYPSGWVAGAVNGSGELEVTTETLQDLLAEAEAAGSWEQMPEFDLSFYAQVGDLEHEVRAFGCKLRMPGFSYNGEGGEQTTHTIPFIVSSPDFVELNGVPLARRRT